MASSAPEIITSSAILELPLAARRNAIEQLAQQLPLLPTAAVVPQCLHLVRIMKLVGIDAPAVIDAAFSQLNGDHLFVISKQFAELLTDRQTVEMCSLVLSTIGRLPSEALAVYAPAVMQFAQTSTVSEASRCEALQCLRSLVQDSTAAALAVCISGCLRGMYQDPAWLQDRTASGKYWRLAPPGALLLKDTKVEIIDAHVKLYYGQFATLRHDPQRKKVEVLFSPIRPNGLVPIAPSLQCNIDQLRVLEEVIPAPALRVRAAALRLAACLPAASLSELGTQILDMICGNHWSYDFLSAADAVVSAFPDAVLRAHASRIADKALSQPCTILPAMRALRRVATAAPITLCKYVALLKATIVNASAESAAGKIADAASAALQAHGAAMATVDEAALKNLLRSSDRSKCIATLESLLQRAAADVPLALEPELTGLRSAREKNVAYMASQLIERLYAPGGAGAAQVSDTTTVGKRKRDDDEDDDLPEANGEPSTALTGANDST